MTIEIIFDRQYTKMPENFENSTIIQVIRIHKSQLSKQFIEYDTDQKFFLKDTTYLLILLLSEDNELWTTLREWTPEKEENYRKLIGSTILCTIKKQYFDTSSQNYKLTDFTTDGKKVAEPF